MHAELLERVDECQSPLFLAVEVGPGTGARDRPVSLFFQAAAEAPTTRGFAAILHKGLNGLNATQVLAVPNDAPVPVRPWRGGFTASARPGMVGMLARIKRQVAAKSAAEPGPKEPAVCGPSRAHRGR